MKAARRGLFRAIFTVFAASLPALGCGVSPSRPVPMGHLILHRGNHSIGSGNTLKGINEALDRGYRYIEVDVRRSADGAFFLFHDKTIRSGNSSAPSGLIGKPAESLTRKNLHLLCSRLYPDACPAFLEDVVSKLHGRRVSLFFDIKNISPTRVSDLLSLLEKHDFTGQSVIQCPSLNCLSYVRRFDDSVRVLVRVNKESEIDPILAAHPYAMQLDVNLLSMKNIERIHQRFVTIVTKTVDSKIDNPRGLELLSGMGVDLILTDVIGEAPHRLESYTSLSDN